MSGYVLTANEGDAYDWRGARVVIKGTAIPGSFVFVPRDRPHGFTVIGDEPARALVIVGPARLDGQIATTGVPVPGRPRRSLP